MRLRNVALALSSLGLIAAVLAGVLMPGPGPAQAFFSAGLLSGFERSEPSAEATLLGEMKKLLASDAQADTEFGRSVAINGDTAVVGAVFDAGGRSSTGAAYVFQRNQGGPDNWGLVKRLAASDAQPGDWFGFSAAISGDTAVVGAIFKDDGRSTVGAAYVFGRNEGGADNWGEVTKLTASDAGGLDYFGWSVAVSGDTAIVGAYQEDAKGTNAGAAYVFGRNEGGADNSGEVTKLTASDAGGGDQFGNVALSGDTAVVGAFGEDAEGTDAGAVYVFGRDEGGAGNWGEVKKLTASDAETNDVFGSIVAVSGDTAVVGAYQEDAGGDNAGAGYVFDLQSESSGSNAAVVAGIVAAVAAGVLALGSAVWYARQGLTAGKGGSSWL